MKIGKEIKMTVRANYNIRESWLGKEFGESYARRLFGDDVVDALPKVSRGKNKGNFKASIRWIKIENGGWVPTESGGFVENRKGAVVVAQLFNREWGSGEVTIYNTWSDDSNSNNKIRNIHWKYVIGR